MNKNLISRKKNSIKNQFGLSDFSESCLAMQTRLFVNDNERALSCVACFVDGRSEIDIGKEPAIMFLLMMVMLMAMVVLVSFLVGITVIKKMFIIFQVQAFCLNL